jgi:atrial natriuretic peptide receptor A
VSVKIKSKLRKIIVIDQKNTYYCLAGVTGHVRIDDSGDRDADYSVLDLDPITGRFEVVAHYYGLSRNYTPVKDKTIHWPGSREGPPPDIPPCGFMGNDPACNSNGNYKVVSCFVMSLTWGDVEL